MPKLPSEVRDVAERLHIVKKKKDDPAEWIGRYIQDLQAAPPAKQCAVGAAIGAVNGYVIGRVGKNAAVAIGGSLILIQVASHMGYIKINWNAIESDIKEAKRELRRREGVVGPLLQDVKEFLSDNMYLGGGFIGGFILGMATA